MEDHGREPRPIHAVPGNGRAAPEPDIPMDLMALRNATLRMNAQSEKIKTAMRKSQISPRGLDFTEIIVETLAMQAWATGILLNELLAIRGEDRVLSFPEPRRIKT